MDIALLFVSVAALAFALYVVIEQRHAKKHVDDVVNEYKTAATGLKEASTILAQLHNEQTIKTKAIGERLENLELRFQGINPQGFKRTV